MVVRMLLLVVLKVPKMVAVVVVVMVVVADVHSTLRQNAKHTWRKATKKKMQIEIKQRTQQLLLEISILLTVYQFKQKVNHMVIFTNCTV